MRIILLPIIKLLAFVITLVMYIPLFGFIFVIVLIWTFDLKYTRSISWPWKPSLVERYRLTGEMVWRPEKPGYRLWYPTFFHQVADYGHKYITEDEAARYNEED